MCHEVILSAMAEAATRRVVQVLFLAVPKTITLWFGDFGEVRYGSQNVGRAEATRRAGAVDGVDNQSGRIEQESGCMKIALLGIVESSGRRGDALGLESEGDRKRETPAPYHLLGVGSAVDGGGDNDDVEMLQSFDSRFKIS
jgi:hypothetical protein